MLEIPDGLRSLFTSSVREEGDEYVLRVPKSEVDNDALAAGGRYRVAVFEAPPPAESTEPQSGATASTASDSTAGGRGRSEPPTPPVDQGEVRTVSIEAIGDQGDGIAKVERGYVVIVPEAAPGDEPTVEIEEVQQNVAFARVIDDARR